MKCTYLFLLSAVCFAQSVPPARPAKPVSNPPSAPAASGKPAVAKAPVTSAAAKAALAMEDSKTGGTLRYAVNWPSGLSLGEASIARTRTVRDGKEVNEYSFQVEAAIPAFAIRESARSVSTAAFCALELEREGTRGHRKIAERTVFDPEHRKAARSTNGGGKTDIGTAGCAKDALTFLDFVRRELAAGRLPATQTVYYGSGYEVRVEYLGSERLNVGGTLEEADRLRVAVKGPGSQHDAEILFTKDSDRTPVQIRLPLAMGRFTLELMR